MNEALLTRLQSSFDGLAPATTEHYVSREDDPLDRFRRTRLGGTKRHCLLTGATGTGKSTALASYADVVAAEPDPPLTYLLRLQDGFTPEELTAAQVLFLVGLADLKIGDGAAPTQLRRKLKNAYKSIVDGGADIDLAVLLAKLAPPVAALTAKAGAPGTAVAIAAAGATASALRGVKRFPLPGRGQTLRSNDSAAVNLGEVVNECIDWVKSHYEDAPVAFFVDGLDRLDPERMKGVFGSGILELPAAPVLYTAPLSVRYNMEGQALDAFQDLPLGNFRVFDQKPDGARNAGGFTAMRRLLERRFEAAGVEPSLALEGGLDGDLVGDLIELSGGIARTLILTCETLFRHSVLDDGDGPVDRAVFTAAVTELERDMSTRLEPGHVPAVIESWATRQRPQGVGSDKLLFLNFVLSHPNDFPWYRPNPLLLRFLRHQYSHLLTDPWMKKPSARP